MEEILSRFKQVYMSPQNVKLILDAVFTTPPSNLSYIKHALFDLQSFIYNEYFVQAFQELHSHGNFNPQDSLAALNRLTISKLAVLVKNEIVEADKQRVGEANKPSTSPNPPNPPTTKQQLCRLFSHDAILNNGRYTFDLPLHNVHSIACTSFSIDCSIYNVTELNNTLELKEHNDLTVINIPVGYYSIPDLLSTLTSLLNSYSIQKSTFSATLHKYKYKVQLSSTNAFNIKFSEQLANILGFSNKQYSNNNVYLAEEHPIMDPFDTMYLRVFVNGQEVPRCKTSNVAFNFFHSLQIPYANNFGKNYTCTLPDDLFDFSTPSSIETISIELFTSTMHPLKYMQSFSCDLLLEHS